MAEEMITFGTVPGLQIQLQWVRSQPGKSAVDATKGRLLLWIGESLIWGEFRGTAVEVSVEWSWIELVEWLSNSWPYLEFESGYPFRLNPVWPARLRGAAESRWQAMPDELVRTEEDELFAFEETHDLARGVHGLFIPSLWLVRERGLMTIGSQRTTVRRPLKETLDTLTQFGDCVASRLTDRTDDRSKAAVRGWRERRTLDPGRFLEIATNCSPEELQELVGPLDPGTAFELPEHDFAFTETLEIVGLARGYLDNDSLRMMIARIKSQGKTVTPEIDSLAQEVTALLDQEHTGKPYNQGYMLANWLRAQPGVAGTDGFVDIEGVLQNFRVIISEISLGSDLLEAVACWGPKHGPAIWLNTSSRRAAVAGARRATLAHELCHLLADRNGALPLADVVNGDVPKWVEQRADAFAAELLLPRAIAQDVAESNNDTEAVVKGLTERFGVSRELTAWQIRNAGVDLSGDRRSRLRSLVSDPENF